MAIRNINAINESMENIKHNHESAVEDIKRELTYYRDRVLSYKEDIVDAIDTFNYCKEIGLGKYLTKYVGSAYHKIVFDKGVLKFQFNNWKAENSGPYNWFVMTDGNNVWISIDDKEDEKAEVSEMARDAYWYEDGDRSKVIAPIKFHWRGETKLSWTCHDANRPLSALKDFAREISTFSETFFKDTETLGNKGE